MKNKFAKIMMALALIVLAPVSVILTGCGQEKPEPSLTIVETNRTVFYLGEDFEDANWQVNYFDGKTTVTVNVTDSMVAGFSIDKVKTANATIIYEGLQTTQNYTVKETPFNTELVYKCVGKSGDAAFLKFDSYNVAKVVNKTDGSENVTKDDSIWDTTNVMTMHLNTFGFVNGKWTAEGSYSFSSATYEVKMTQESSTRITVVGKDTSGSTPNQTLDFVAID